MNEENKIIDVKMSDIEVATNPHILRSSGIGSCVVVTLYDPEQRAGAMSHSMLAEQQENNKTVKPENNLRFVENAIDVMIGELLKIGVAKEQLEAKIIGGANMFEVFDKNPNSIGVHNVEAARNKLEKEGIKIIANDTGGNVGRSVVFELDTGLVEVKTKI